MLLFIFSFLQEPVDKKNYSIPKYAGFIPGMNANSELGRAYTKITRRCFDKEQGFQDTFNRFKSTGKFYDDQ